MSSHYIEIKKKSKSSGEGDTYTEDIDGDTVRRISSDSLITCWGKYTIRWAYLYRI